MLCIHLSLEKNSFPVYINHAHGPHMKALPIAIAATWAADFRQGGMKACDRVVEYTGEDM